MKVEELWFKPRAGIRNKLDETLMIPKGKFGALEQHTVEHRSDLDSSCRLVIWLLLPLCNCVYT